jgi:phenylpyruvate tautomerase PptA (4-oxalocrotonate tautomerase family)
MALFVQASTKARTQNNARRILLASKEIVWVVVNEMDADNPVVT